MRFPLKTSAGLLRAPGLGVNTSSEHSWSVYGYLSYLVYKHHLTLLALLDPHTHSTTHTIIVNKYDSFEQEMSH